MTRSTRRVGGALPFKGVRIARIRGIEADAHWSLFVIFALISIGLAQGVFPSMHPEWSPALAWTLGVLGAVLFLASILVHELAHAIVGNHHGIPVHRITLFLFGGVSHMEGFPPNARAELLMAGAGPLTSILLGGLGIVVALIVPDPAASLFAWLGLINLALAAFNLVPGFPLDGGRLLRAALWRITGDLRRATRWATDIGAAFSYLLIGTGAVMLFGGRVPYLGGSGFQGLWLILIGWLLNQAGSASYRQLVIREELRDVPATRLMRTRILYVSPSMHLDELVDRFIMTSEQRTFPVVHGTRFLGLVSTTDVRRVARDAWPARTIESVMTPLDQIDTVAPEASADEVHAKLAGHPTHEVPVVHEGRLLGLVSAQEIEKWLSLAGNQPTPHGRA